MATVSNVRLSISSGSTPTRRRASVSYTICFSPCEATAGSTFIEKVTLRGDDPVWDDHLVTLRNGCIKAQAGCVERKWSRDVAASTLDEDPDTIILGWVIGNRDEVYARVKLTPFTPSGSQGDSNTVKSDFGPAGA